METLLRVSRGPNEKLCTIRCRALVPVGHLVGHVLGHRPDMMVPAPMRTSLCAWMIHSPLPRLCEGDAPV